MRLFRQGIQQRASHGRECQLEPDVVPFYLHIAYHPQRHNILVQFGVDNLPQCVEHILFCNHLSLLAHEEFVIVPIAP